MGKIFYVYSFIGLVALLGCGKDENASATPQAIPTTGAPAPVNPAPAPAPAPPPAPAPAPTSQPGGQSGPGYQGQNGDECFCDYWGCYVCGSDDWCCEVNTCNGATQQQLGNYFSRTTRY